MLHPGDCSPSRSVVSKMYTRLFTVATRALDLRPAGLFRRIGHKTIIERDFGFGKFIIMLYTINNDDIIS